MKALILILWAALACHAQVQSYRFTLIKKADGSAAGVFDIRDGGTIKPPATGVGTAFLGDSTHRFTSAFINSLSIYSSALVKSGATMTVQSGGVVNFATGSTFTLEDTVVIQPPATGVGAAYLGDSTHRFTSAFVNSLSIYGSSFIKNAAQLTTQSGGLQTINDGGFLAVNGAGTFLLDGNINIVTNNTWSVGDTSHRLAKAWAVDLDVSGTCTGCGGFALPGTYTNTSLATTGLTLKDASGTTTGNSIELQTFGGTIFFKIIGGTDSGAPGTVVTRSLVPFTDNLYILGNNTHMWNTVYAYAYAAPAGAGINQTLACVAGQHVNSVTVSAGIIVAGFTCTP